MFSGRNRPAPGYEPIRVWKKKKEEEDIDVTIQRAKWFDREGQIDR